MCSSDLSSCLEGILTPAACTLSPNGFFSPQGAIAPVADGKCDAGYGVDVPATDSTDTQCEPCQLGVTWNGASDSFSECHAITGCGPGQGVFTPASQIFDTVCTPCLAWMTYSHETSITAGCQVIPNCTYAKGVGKLPPPPTDTPPPLLLLPPRPTLLHPYTIGRTASPPSTTFQTVPAPLFPPRTPAV